MSFTEGVLRITLARSAQASKFGVDPEDSPPNATEDLAAAKPTLQASTIGKPSHTNDAACCPKGPNIGFPILLNL